MLRLQKKIEHRFIFKPPTLFQCFNDNIQKQIKYLENHYHGIQWNEGSYSYCNHRCIITSVLSNAHCIFTKGCEKVTWIQKYTSAIVCNIEDYECFDTLKHLRKQYSSPLCETHREKQLSQMKPYMCALENALNLFKFCEKMKLVDNEHDDNDF